MLPKVNYTKKKFLVIDDFPEFRSSIKKMVESFGGEYIETASNGEDAIEKIEKTKFDIVLSDYNLGGDGKDGQQVLEEAKHRGLLKASTIYIMLTAESTIKMVMGALEYEPDGYLTKPFNKIMLLGRLEKIAEKKEKMAEIHKAIDRKNPEKAMKLCDAEVKSQSKIMIDCLKIKAKLLTDDAQYAKAKKIYEQVLNVRRLPWALMGIGKALYYQGEFYDASDAFQDLIEENNMCVEAYDWLAKCKEKLGDTEDAQEILQEAVKLSPKAILRQQMLGEFARENDDSAVAEKALRQAVNLGKFSCHRNPDNALDLADVLLEKLTPDAGIKGKRAGNEALEVLKNVARQYPKDNTVAAKAAMLEISAHKGLKQDNEAKKSLSKAAAAFDKLGSSAPADVAIGMAEAYMEMGKADKAQEIAMDVIRKNFEDENLADRIKEMSDKVGLGEASEALIAEEQEKIDNLNQEGVALFKAGKLQEAVDLFDKAAEEMPENVSVCLNAAQALITFMEEHGKDNKMLNRSRKYLDRVKGMDQEDKRYARYMELQRLQLKVAKS